MWPINKPSIFIWKLLEIRLHKFGCLELSGSRWSAEHSVLEITGILVFQLCEPELVYQYFYNYMLTRILGDYQATFPSRKTNFTLFSKENAQRYYFVAQSNWYLVPGWKGEGDSGVESDLVWYDVLVYTVEKN